jgi:hypothetical protein
MPMPSMRSWKVLVLPAKFARATSRLSLRPSLIRPLFQFKNIAFATVFAKQLPFRIKLRYKMTGAAEEAQRIAGELHTLIGLNDGTSRPPLPDARRHRIRNPLAVDRKASGQLDNLAG